MGETSQMPLRVLGSAIALTAAGTADAALISTAGTSFTPVTITAGTTGSYSFDLDANGSQDFSITAATGSVDLQLNLLTANSAASSTFDSTGPYSSASSLNISNVKHYADALRFTGSSPAPNNYLALATNFVRTTPGDAFSRGTGSLGYLQGDFTPAVTGATPASFRLLDFGVVTSDVPEPASWVMMIAGFGGIGALRRRAWAKAASPATC